MYPEDQPSEFALHQSRAAVGPSASTGASLLWRGNPLGIPLPELSLEPTPNRSRRWPLAAYRDGDSGSPCGRDRRFRVG